MSHCFSIVLKKDKVSSVSHEMLSEVAKQTNPSLKHVTVKAGLHYLTDHQMEVSELLSHASNVSMQPPRFLFPSYLLYQ